MKAQTKEANAVIRIFTDGSGCRPDGKGSGFAWLREDTGARKIERIDGLTNNEAEYSAVLSALQGLQSNMNIEILCDSELVCCQFNGKWRVSNPSLSELLSTIRDLVKSKGLRVKLTWIPRRENLAGKML
jgi:ribonuclease HI